MIPKIYLLIFFFSLTTIDFSYAQQTNNILDCRDIEWNKIPAGALKNIPFKPVEPGLLEHDQERRGFVSVPLDYSFPNDSQIEIFYRLMPTDNGGVSNSDKPILVVMNGGPGSPSSGYRALEHDYQGENEDDAFAELSKYFRILAVDQRGTGNSAPLDLDDPSLPQEVIARFFDSDEHARDHAKVIDAVIPEGDTFFILARSYGGHIGFHYLTLEGNRRQPAGLIFSSALLPHSDALETFLLRRKKQKELSLDLHKSHPQVIAKLGRLKTHFQEVGMDPNAVNFLWAYLGRGNGWESDLEREIDQLLSMKDRSAIEAELGSGIQQSVNLLNYVLSSSALTPGFTDRSITEETNSLVPFEEWMLDENWALTQIGNDGTWREEFICVVDRNPPPPTYFPSIEDIRKALGETHVLFTFGKSDAFLPQDLQLKSAQRFAIPGHTEYRVFSGGHGAAFSSEGAKIVHEWASKIIGNEKINFD